MALSPPNHECSVQALGFYTRFVTGEVAIPCVISAPYQLPVTIGVRLGGLLSHPNLFNVGDFDPNISDFGMALGNATSNAAVDPNLVHVLVAPIPPAAATNNGKMSVVLELCHGETGQLLMTLPCVDLPIFPPTQQAITPSSSNNPTSCLQQAVKTSQDRKVKKAAPTHPQPERTNKRLPVAPAGPPPLRVIGSGLPSDRYSGPAPSPTLVTFGCFQHDIAGELAVPVILLNPTSQVFELWISCNGTRVSYEIRMLDDMERLFPGLSLEEAHAMRVLLVSNVFHLVDPPGHLKVEISVHTLSGALVISGQCATLYWNGREWSSVIQHAVAVPGGLHNPLPAPSHPHSIRPPTLGLPSPLPYPVPPMVGRHSALLPAIQEEGSSLELELEPQQIATSTTSTAFTSQTTSALPSASTRFPLATIDEDDEMEPQDHLSPLSPLSSPHVDETVLPSTIQNALINTSVLENHINTQPDGTAFAPGPVESHTEPPIDPEINPLRFPWRNPALYNAATEYEVPFYDGGASNNVAQGPETPSKPSPSTLAVVTVITTSASRSTIPDSPSSLQQRHQHSPPVGVPPALTIIEALERMSSPDLPLAQTSITPQVQKPANPQVQAPMLAKPQVQARAATKSKAAKVEAKENVAPNAGRAVRTSRETGNRAQPYTKASRQSVGKGAAGKATK